MGNNFQTTLILLVIAAGLSFYAWKFEGVADWKEPVAAAFPAVTRESIRQIEVSPGPAMATEGNEILKSTLRLVLGKPDAAGLAEWTIAEPIEFPAFRPRIEGLLRGIVDLQRIKSVTADRAEAFFEDGGLLMTIQFLAGENEHRIEVGREHPEDYLGLVCVRVDGEDAFLTREKFRRLFLAPVDGFRSRALFPVSAERAERLEITRFEQGEASSTVALEREEGRSGGWRLLPPHRGQADRAYLKRVLDELNAWRIEGFEADSLQEPERFGLDRPRLRIVLTNSEGRTFDTIFAADSSDESADEVHAHRQGTGFVFRVAAAPLELVDVEADTFRSQTLLQLGASEIRRVRGEVRHGGEERGFLLKRIVVERKGDSRANEDAPAEVRWEVEDHRLEQAWEADKALSSNFFSHLKNIDVLRYLEEDSGTRERIENETALLSLELEFDTGAAMSVDFFAPPDGVEYPDTSFIARRSDSGELPLVLTRAPIDLRPGGIYFRDRQISNFEVEDLHSFSVMAYDGTKWSLAEVGGRWHVAENAFVKLKRDGSLNEQLISKAIVGLSRHGFRIAAYLPDQDDLKALELIAGRRRLHVVLESGFNREDFGYRTLSIGARRDQSPGQESYAKLNSIDMPVLLPPSVVDPLLELVEHLREITDS